MRKQLSKMGRNKACGPDDLPIEAVMVVAEMKPELLTYILHRIMTYGIPDSWKKSTFIPILKNKGDILECNNYRGIKSLHETMGKNHRSSTERNCKHQRKPDWLQTRNVNNRASLCIAATT